MSKALKPFDPPLFWRSDYVSLQDNTAYLVGIDWGGRIRVESIEEGLRTWMVIQTNSGTLRSPCRATFGGFFTRGTILESDIEQIVQWISKTIAARALQIYLPPNYLTSLSAIRQIEVLQKLGGSIVFRDSNFHLPAKTWSTSDLSKGNRKKLRQWREAGGVTERVSHDYLPKIYEIIQTNRATLGVVPSISLGDLKKLVDAFPDHYQLFVGRVSTDLAVVSVQVRVTHDVNYVFFWADKRDFRHLSPVVAMCEHLVLEARSSGVEVLDLGIASERGTTNAGLERFKRNLGALESAKLHLEIVLK